MTATRRAAAIALVATLAALVVASAGLLFGAKAMRLDALLTALTHPYRGLDGIILWSLRIPRGIAAFLAGAGLAVSGHLLQTITRNPLAAPDLSGVSAGAVVLIVATFIFLPGVSTFFYAPIGLVGGLGAAAATIWIARGAVASPIRLALGGVTISLFLGAVTTYILLLGGPQSPSIMFWLSGGFQGRSWSQLGFMLPWVAIGTGAAFVCHRIIDLIALGDEAAAGMGLDTGAWRLALLLAAICPVAGVTPVAGPIAFVGLVAPHLVRLTRPPSTLWAIVLNLAVGGLMLTTADALARSLAAPRELPISILTALIGGPFFVFMVQRRDFAAGAGRTS